MTVRNDELVPFDFFTRLIHSWWLVVLLAFIGGGAGLLVHNFRPPVYEAQAVLTASIDYNKINFLRPPAGSTPVPYQFSQYDEDLALSAIDASLQQVIPQVISYAQKSGSVMDADTFAAQSTVERRHAIWDVRYRSSDPAFAQKVVNYWAQQGFADLKVKRSEGTLEPYITFDLVQLADLPTKPAYLQTNTFVFAGGILGLIAGLLAVNLPFFGAKKNG
jgi:uncharacterized protein involved in exopolysaccharide biosynthesis